MATKTFNATALANGTSNLLVRASALNQSTDLVQAGVVFNDAVRASLGLFSLAGSGNSEPVPRQLHDRHPCGAERHRRDARQSGPGHARRPRLHAEHHRHRGPDQRPGAAGHAAARQRRRPPTRRRWRLPTRRSTRCSRRSCGEINGDAAPLRRAQQRALSWPIPAPMTSRSRTCRQAPMIRPSLAAATAGH